MGLETFQTGSLAASREIGTALDMIRTVQNVVSQRIADKLAEERIKNAEIQRQALIQQIKRQQEAWQWQARLMDESMKAVRQLSEIVTSLDPDNLKQGEDLRQKVASLAWKAALTEEGRRAAEMLLKSLQGTTAFVVKNVQDTAIATNAALLAQYGYPIPVKPDGSIDQFALQRTATMLRLSQAKELPEAVKMQAQMITQQVLETFKIENELRQLAATPGAKETGVTEQLQSVREERNKLLSDFKSILQEYMPKTVPSPAFMANTPEVEKLWQQKYPHGIPYGAGQGVQPQGSPPPASGETADQGKNILFDVVVPDPSDLTVLPQNMNLAPDLKETLEQFSVNTASVLRQVRDAVKKQHRVVAQGKGSKDVYQENLLTYLYAYYAARLIRDAIAQGLVDDPVLYLNNATERINLVKSRGYELAKALAERGDPFWSRLFKEKTPVHERILKLLQGGNLVELPNIVTAK